MTDDDSDVFIFSVLSHVRVVVNMVEIIQGSLTVSSNFAHKAFFLMV